MHKRKKMRMGLRAKLTYKVIPEEGVIYFETPADRAANIGVEVERNSFLVLKDDEVVYFETVVGKAAVAQLLAQSLIGALIAAFTEEELDNPTVDVLN